MRMRIRIRIQGVNFNVDPCGSETLWPIAWYSPTAIAAPAEEGCRCVRFQRQRVTILADQVFIEAHSRTDKKKLKKPYLADFYIFSSAYKSSSLLEDFLLPHSFIHSFSTGFFANCSFSASRCRVSDPHPFHADPDPGFWKRMQIQFQRRIWIQGLSFRSEKGKQIFRVRTFSNILTSMNKNWKFSMKS